MGTVSNFSHTNSVTPDVADISTLIEDWATLTTDAWTKEVQQEWKRKQRCETLARFRVQKKEEVCADGT